MFPVVNHKLWRQIVYRFQAPNPYHAKRLGVTGIPLPIITEYIQFPLHDSTMMTWIESVPPECRLYTFHDDECPSCLGGDIRFINKEGSSICFSCGYVVSENAQESSYTESHGSAFATNQKDKFPRRLTISSTKRVNHFKFWLSRLQGNEHCKITDVELQQLTQYLESHHLLSTLDYDTIRSSLKQLGFQRYYNNSFYFLKHFTGYALVSFEKKHEQQLIKLFHLIQPAFTRHAGNRINMLSYAYLIRKFSELLEWEDIVWSIPSMKSDANIQRQDAIWKCICEDMDFPYTKSVL